MILDNITMLRKSTCLIERLASTIGVLLLLAIATVSAVPQIDQSEKIIPILKQSQDGPNPDGTYSWSYETGNSIRADERGSIVHSANNGEATSTSVQGSYSYIGNDGTPFHVTYTADENGFRPMGVHFPDPPEIPPAILKALQWIADHPEEDNLRK